jgi:hypothetical protein
MAIAATPACATRACLPAIVLLIDPGSWRISAMDSSLWVVVLLALRPELSDQVRYRPSGVVQFVGGAPMSSATDTGVQGSSEGSSG